MERDEQRACHQDAVSPKCKDCLYVQSWEHWHRLREQLRREITVSHSIKKTDVVQGEPSRAIHGCITCTGCSDSQGLRIVHSTSSSTDNEADNDHQVQACYATFKNRKNKDEALLEAFQPFGDCEVRLLVSGNFPNTSRKHALPCRTYAFPSRYHPGPNQRSTSRAIKIATEDRSTDIPP